MPAFAPKWVIFGVLALVLSTSHSAAALADADARAQVAAALYAASATQAAAEKQTDAKLKLLRKSIDQLQEKVHSSAADAAGLRSELAVAQEKFVADLAVRDRAYSEEIAIFRAAVQDIAATPEGAAALAKYNAGDRKGALAILDKLDEALDAALKKRQQIESAAHKRSIARLALDARLKGDVTTLDAIGRFERVVELDPGVHWDWVELGRLYRSAGRLGDAKEASRRAAESARTERDQSVDLHELGDVQVKQGDLAGALASYRKALHIAERLAAPDPGNTDWQRDLSISYERVGDVQVKQGDLVGALASYRKAQGIAERLAARDPGNTDWQRDLSISYERVGDVQVKQGDLAGALVSYRKDLGIAERLAARDPGNTDWQRDLIVSLVKLGTASGDKTYFKRAFDITESLQKSGRLAPADAWMVDKLQQLAHQ